MGADWQRTPCWVPVDADGKALEIYERTPHYESEADALIGVTERGYRADDDKAIAGVKALPQPCVELHCDGCGEEYEDDEAGYGIHFTNPDGAIRAGRESEWTFSPDGTAHCWACPPLAASPPPVEHVPGQLTLDGAEPGEGHG